MSLSRNARYGLLLGDGFIDYYGALVDLSNGQQLEWLFRGIPCQDMDAAP